jgi:hypothetical protein
MRKVRGWGGGVGVRIQGAESRLLFWPIQSNLVIRFREKLGETERMAGDGSSVKARRRGDAETWSVVSRSGGPRYESGAMAGGDIHGELVYPYRIAPSLESRRRVSRAITTPAWLGCRKLMRDWDFGGIAGLQLRSILRGEHLATFNLPMA